MLICLCLHHLQSILAALVVAQKLCFILFINAKIAIHLSRIGAPLSSFSNPLSRFSGGLLSSIHIGNNSSALLACCWMLGCWLCRIFVLLGTGRVSSTSYPLYSPRWCQFNSGIINKKIYIYCIHSILHTQFILTGEITDCQTVYVNACV